jgi:hypothetical protein
MIVELVRKPIGNREKDDADNSEKVKDLLSHGASK